MCKHPIRSVTGSGLFLWLSPCPMAAEGIKTYVKIQKRRIFWEEKKPTIRLPRLSEQGGALDALELSYNFCHFLQLLYLVHCPVFLWSIVKKKTWYQQWWIYWTTKRGDHLRAPSVTWQLLMWYCSEPSLMHVIPLFIASLSPSVYGKQFFYHTIKTEPLKGYSLSLLSRQTFQSFAEVCHV